MQCPHCKQAWQGNSPACSCGFRPDGNAAVFLGEFTNINSQIQRMDTMVSHLRNGLTDMRQYVGRLQPSVQEMLDRSCDRQIQSPPVEAGQTEFAGSEATDSSKAASTLIAPEADTSTAAELSDVVEVELVDDTKTKQESVSPKAGTPQSSLPNLGLEFKLGQVWLLVGGIIAVVLGLGYFLKYSFEQNWIGPPMRIAMAYAAALGLGYGAHVSIEKGLGTFGRYLFGGAIAAGYFATFTGWYFYSLFPTGIAWPVMVAITALAGVLSVRHDAMGLAILGLVGGFSTPFILGEYRGSAYTLLSYVVVLNVGLLVISFYKRWQPLQQLTFWATQLTLLVWMVDQYNASYAWLAVGVVNILFIIYAVAPIAVWFRQTQAMSVRKDALSFIMQVTNALSMLSFNHYLFGREFSLEAMGYVVAAAGALMVYLGSLAQERVNHNQANPVLVGWLQVKAGVFFTIAAGLWFAPFWQQVVWIIMGVGASMMAIRTKNIILRLFSAALMGIALVDSMAYQYDNQYAFDALHMAYMSGFDFMVWQRWVFALIGLGALAYIARGEYRYGLAKVGHAWAAAAIVMLFVFTTLEVAAFTYDVLPKARLASLSVLWGIFGISMMMSGLRRDVAVLRRIALALFAIVGFKVLFIDMGQVSTPYRILSGIGVGGMMILGSLFYHRKARAVSGGQA